MRSIYRHTLLLLSLGTFTSAPHAQQMQDADRFEVLVDNKDAHIMSIRHDTIQSYDDKETKSTSYTQVEILGSAKKGLPIAFVKPGYVAAYVKGRMRWFKVSDLNVSSDLRFHGCGPSYVQTVFNENGFNSQQMPGMACLMRGSPRATVDVPFLPWPAPNPSHVDDLTKQFRPPRQVSEISNEIVVKLKARGFDRLRYFSLPGGFAITTPVERYKADGAPEIERWVRKKVARTTGFREYFRSLLFGEQGNFRLFVFAVTNTDMSVAPFQATQNDVERWEALGRPALSHELAGQKLPSGTKVWLLLYEFHPSADSKTRLVAGREPNMPLAIHLKALGFK